MFARLLKHPFGLRHRLREMLRSAALVLVACLAALAVLSGCGTSSSGGGNKVTTVQQAETAFEEFESRKGESGPLQDVSCSPQGESSFGCSGATPQEPEPTVVTPTLYATVGANGVVGGG